MLRRNPTVIKLTPEDLHAYDDIQARAPGATVPNVDESRGLGLEALLSSFKPLLNVPAPQLENLSRDARVGVNTTHPGE